MSVNPISYSAFDRERFVDDGHRSHRGDFQRDRGRIIHSSGFRRLAQKTQVLSPTSGVDFARNRLTHLSALQRLLVLGRAHRGGVERPHVHLHEAQQTRSRDVVRRARALASTAIAARQHVGRAGDGVAGARAGFGHRARGPVCGRRDARDGERSGRDAGRGVDRGRSRGSRAPIELTV